MTHDRINNVNIISEEPLPTPDDIREHLPLTSAVEETVYAFRDQLRSILDHQDHRLLAVVGPCSIHNIDSAIEYARRLKSLSDELSDRMVIVMRVYFEKPRTTIGWKGLINDPGLDDSFQIGKGLYLAREFLLKLGEMELPVGTEALDPITPQYIGDLVSWTAIGARTTESQTHRELASGLSTPVGFKNGTDGNIAVAVNALKSVFEPHHFLGITQKGECAVFHTGGNKYGHIVLRGGDKPNHDSQGIADCEKQLAEAGLPLNIVVDCSHGNSESDPGRQAGVLSDCVEQIRQGNRSIVGFMIESNISAGKQSIPSDLSNLKPDVSVTDACIGWEATEMILRNAHEKLREALPGRTG